LPAHGRDRTRARIKNVPTPSFSPSSHRRSGKEEGLREREFLLRLHPAARRGTATPQAWQISSSLAGKRF